MKQCLLCGRNRHLILNDGPVRCRLCVWKAAREGAEVEAVWRWMQDGAMSSHAMVRR